MLLAALILADIVLRLANPQIIRMFIDTAEAGGPLSALWSAGALFLAVGLLGRGVSLGAAYAGLNLGWTATNRLRTDLAGHLLRLDMPFHKAHTPGELIERVDGDVTTLAEFFAEMAVKVVGNALLMFAILALLARENAGAGVILAGYTILVLLALLLAGRIGVRAWTAARQAWADQMGFLEERIAGTEDIRGIGAEAHALAQLSELMLNLLRKARGGWMANALSFAVTNFLFIVGYGLGLAIGALLYLRGDVTIGAAFLIVTYIGMLATPLEEIRGQVEQLQEATASINRVDELLSLTPAVRDTGSETLPHGPLPVDFEGVCFRYNDGDGASEQEQAASRGDAVAPPLATASPLAPASPMATLADISFHLPPGRVLGVLGRTGSGKTTMTRLLCRLYDPEEGAIRLAGCDLRDIPLADLRRTVGLVTQDVQLFGATVRENIALFDVETPEADIRRALGELELLDWVLQMPQGLETKLAAGGGNMSAGEAQLLAFARLLLRDPGLVILDEATSRLDPLTERRLERAIDRLLRGEGTRRSAIIIAHRLHTVQRADDILILHEGRILEFGPRATLAADPDSRFSQLLRTGLEEALA